MRGSHNRGGGMENGKMVITSCCYYHHSTILLSLSNRPDNLRVSKIPVCSNNGKRALHTTSENPRGRVLVKQKLNDYISHPVYVNRGIDDHDLGSTHETEI
jgi:hypothetical protein